jgi:murein tripeptide amidase MpaA
MRLALMMAVILFCTQTGSTTMPKTNEQTPKSRAELTNYEETSRYEEVMSFVGELQKRSSNVRVESFGKTEEGRELPLLILSQPAISTAREAHASGKPVVFIMANIHAGEVEGKEAMLHFARRVLLGDLKPLLNSLVLLIAPIYNADGNEKISLENRTAQNGPIGGVGTRENSKGMDLNRDYMKLESPEATALISLFNRWDPHLTVDLHTTNGSYHGYHLTYSPSLNPNVDPRLISFERERMLPVISRALQRLHKFRTYYYGNFATRESLGRELNRFSEPKAGEAQTRVWRTFDHRPRSETTTSAFAIG